MRIRHMIHLIESRENTRTLYRGDASKIDTFSSEKSRNSIGLLFGIGIYLTDNPRVALDYTIKGGWRHDGSGTVMTPEEETEEQAVRRYIFHIMVKQFGWIQHREQLKTDAIQRLYRELPSPQAARWTQDGAPSPEWTKHDEDRKAFEEAFRRDMKKEFAKVFNKAKKVYQADRANLRAFQDTAGKWRIMRNNHEGTLTVFEIPEEYCRRTLHGDRPLAGADLELIKDFVRSIIGDRPSDFRDADGYATDLPFDQWLEHFRKHGTIYAWQQRVVGGKGEYPTLDEVWNGQHGGYSIFSKHIDDFIAMAKARGYTGVEYDGGVRLGGNIRGGGGIRHQSFVFWDDEFINKCRVEQRSADYPEPSENAASKVTPERSHRFWIDPGKL